MRAGVLTLLIPTDAALGDGLAALLGAPHAETPKRIPNDVEEVDEAWKTK